jgi:hypothetical protein
MAVTPQEFFSKNMKWFALAFFLLFIFSSVRSCNHNMGVKITEKHNMHTIDSLTKNRDILLETIKEKDFRIEQLNEKLDIATKYGNDFRTLAEQATKRNTTIINNIPKEDTTKRK